MSDVAFNSVFIVVLRSHRVTVDVHRVSVCFYERRTIAHVTVRANKVIEVPAIFFCVRQRAQSPILSPLEHNFVARLHIDVEVPSNDWQVGSDYREHGVCCARHPMTI